MLEVKILDYNDLDESEKENEYDEGCTFFLKVIHNGKTILLESDNMEPEDCLFIRDLSWISGIIKKAYELGVDDGIKTQGNK